MHRTSVGTRARVSSLVGVLVCAAGTLSATAASASPPPEHKVTICHRTGSEAGGNMGNGYSLITVDVASILRGAGHDGHAQVGNGPGGDIIPAFSYDGGYFPGQPVGLQGPLTQCPPQSPVPLPS